jgi:4-aminobutyrate aminotransferase-like enzyme
MEPFDGQEFVGRLFRKGILAVTGGTGIRIFPPLIIGKQMLVTSLDILEETIREVSCKSRHKGCGRI